MTFWGFMDAHANGLGWLVGVTLLAVVWIVIIRAASK
jgi:hypothetical protein